MIRMTRLQGYTWTPEQEKDYEDLYQSWSASDMAAEIVNREILAGKAQAKSLADERRIQELVEALQFAEAAIEAAREVYRIKGDLPGYELMGIALSKARAALRVETQERK